MAAKRNATSWLVTYGAFLVAGLVVSMVGIGRGVALARDAPARAMAVTPAQLAQHFDVRRTHAQLADDLTFFYNA
jgi:hypothetical protein